MCRIGEGCCQSRMPSGSDSDILIIVPYCKRVCSPQCMHAHITTLSFTASIGLLRKLVPTTKPNSPHIHALPSPHIHALTSLCMHSHTHLPTHLHPFACIHTLTSHALTSLYIHTLPSSPTHLPRASCSTRTRRSSGGTRGSSGTSV